MESTEGLSTNIEVAIGLREINNIHTALKRQQALGIEGNIDSPSIVRAEANEVKEWINRLYELTVMNGTDSNRKDDEVLGKIIELSHGPFKVIVSTPGEETREDHERRVIIDYEREGEIEGQESSFAQVENLDFMRLRTEVKSLGGNRFPTLGYEFSISFTDGENNEPLLYPNREKRRLSSLEEMKAIEQPIVVLLAMQANQFLRQGASQSGTFPQNPQ